MASRTGTAHVVTTTRTYKGTVYRTHLLRRSYREDGKVKNETLGNLSHLPEPLIEIIRRSLQGETFVPLGQAFEVTGSLAHGHVQAVELAMQRLDFASLLGSKPSPERERVLAMVAARIVAPHTKLATTRWWHTTTLATDFGVADANEDDLYAAMDWLLARQDAIQKKLAARHLSAGGLVLYDLSSSYFEGTTCPLARLGHNRDGKKGLLQVNYGLLTDARGCPVAVSVYEGNVADSSTFLPEVQRLRESFGVGQLVMVGDRGMISSKAIDELRETQGIDWITALKSASIRALVEQGQLQLGLFDEHNLMEIASPEYPGERLVACRNPQLATLRAHKRQDLLAATEKNLQQIKERVEAGRLKGADAIGLRVGKVVNQYKVAKHFELQISDGSFSFTRKHEAIAAEAALDGIYIIRTSVEATRMEAAECVRNYKALANVERAFRSLKTVDLKVRPIHHRTAARVRAHILLCMLAYYVEWHMLEAWRELMFADTDLAAKATRDPVAPAQRSQQAQEKVVSRTVADGSPVHSFSTLMAELGSIVRNTCRTPGAGPEAPTFDIITTPNVTQRHALDLIRQIHP
ncbi:DDE family transposase [Paraburkholderia sp. BL23I1N1]|uniref:IS1634 family transposase n=1 Tax=Paraburkholderia sp. BL23I1N1 TaxID=1938802 RepID=UPI000E73EBCF|nr:DDE family transposase [Paraburkholderia sp. BL23I1N1]RKE34790.1 IS4 family transposase [Paraburkholderia sp. BL23I1N1]RKE35202.1 DDE family transposase [Paraburkholderia sp. BL23I1N1]RKE38710.1 DDE family transposase [Paraburkholderia sp. BL23I1N1]RKE39428.1 DDE family transposase [Paraburkholderia sp. BL23I1N1]